MKVIADLCVVPLGVGVSVSKYVVACQEVIEAAGLESKMHAYGTNVEGEWEAVFGALKDQPSVNGFAALYLAGDVFSVRPGPRDLLSGEVDPEKPGYARLHGVDALANSPRNAFHDIGRRTDDRLGAIDDRMGTRGHPEDSDNAKTSCKKPHPSIPSSQLIV